jgi:hypothetical protein
MAFWQERQTSPALEAPRSIKSSELTRRVVPRRPGARLIEAQQPRSGPKSASFGACYQELILELTLDVKLKKGFLRLDQGWGSVGEPPVGRDRQAENLGAYLIKRKSGRLTAQPSLGVFFLSSS